MGGMGAVNTGTGVQKTLLTTTTDPSTCGSRNGMLARPASILFGILPSVPIPQSLTRYPDSLL